MRKTYLLRVEGKHPDRLLEAAKHEIRKYIKRERRRVLPAGVDFWDFGCQFGVAKDAAVPIHVAAITNHIDAVAAAAGLQFYIEVLAKHGVRTKRTPDSGPSGKADASHDNDHA